MPGRIDGIQLSPAEKKDLGEITLRRIRNASFRTRPFSGGSWTRQPVKVDGNTSLLLQEGKDDCGNSCDLHLYPYGCGNDELCVHFGWGNTSYEDLGKMSVQGFERFEKKGNVPQGKALDERMPSFKKGHIYRIKNDWHWKADILVAFENY